MRWLALAATVLLGGSTAARGQATAGSAPGGDIGLTYQYVHSNTQPGHCGCFALTGAGVSYSRNFTPTIAGVAELSAGFASNGPDTGNSLTLVSYLFGGRYYIQQPFFHGDHAPQPFGQALVGMAHAGGGIAGAGDHTYALAGRLGAGVDVPVTAGISVRLLQVDYYLTDFANAANGHQNNYLIGAGVALHWAHPQ